MLFMLQSAFSLWMLVDALGRPGIHRYWYFVVMMPFGEWAYFLKYKIHDPEFAWLMAPFVRLRERRVTLDELRYRAEESPSVDNRVALGQALYDADEHREAATLFADVLTRDRSSTESLYGLGAALIALDEDEAALEPLRRLNEVEPAHESYEGWLLLAQAEWHSDRRDDALTTLERLVRRAPRIRHRMVYAHYLTEAERRAEAQEQLVTALREFEYAPKFLRRQDKALAKQARQMLRDLTASSA